MLIVQPMLFPFFIALEGGKKLFTLRSERGTPPQLLRKFTTTIKVFWGFNMLPAIESVGHDVGFRALIGVRGNCIEGVHSE